MDNNIVSEIKKRISIVDLISNYVTLKKRGRSFLGLCPFHKEKTPSFNVNEEKGYYKCFGCGESGDIFKFIQKYENVEFIDALKILAEKAGVDLPNDNYDSSKKSLKEEIYLANGYAVQYFRSRLKQSSEALSYISRRGITPEACEKFSLGYAPEGWNGLTEFLREKKISDKSAIEAGLIKQSDKNTNSVYDIFRNRIIYPIFTSFGKPVGFGGRNMNGDEPKYLNTPETPVFSKGKEFYGLNFAKDRITKENQAIIVEGYMDVIACHSNGIENAVAVLGTSLTKDHIERISRYTKNIVLCFDADKAGIKAAVRNGELFLQNGINPKVAVTPEGEDPDSFLKTRTRADFLKIIDQACELLEFEINLCFEKYDLSRKDERINALNEACMIIAKESNSIRREVLISKIVQFHPSSYSSVAENSIRLEVNKYLKNVSDTGSKQEIQIKKEVPKYDRYEKAERIILSGVCNGYYSLDVFDIIDESFFMIEADRKLAAKIIELYRRNEAPSYSFIENFMRENNFSDYFYDLISINEKLYENSVYDLADMLSVRKNKSNFGRRTELESRLKNGVLTLEEQKELIKLIRGK